MKKPLILLSLSLCAVVLAGSWQAVSARAESNDGISSTGLESTETSLTAQREQLREAQKQAAQQKVEAEKEKLEAERQKAAEERERLADEKKTEAKKKVCQNRENAIKKIIERTATNGQHHYDMITKVYTNVKTFATKKNIDLTGADFATLVTNIDAAATAAQTAINDAKTAGDGFSCDTGAPKSAASVFLAAKKAQAAALKAYRDAVKQLLVAVKSSVQKADSSSESDSDTSSNDTTTTGGTQ